MAQRNADADQAAALNKISASDAVHVNEGPSEASRSILQPEDSDRIQATVTRSEHAADDASIGTPSVFSTGLNVCLEPAMDAGGSESRC
jgi:hypothetical protein